MRWFKTSCIGLALARGIRKVKGLPPKNPPKPKLFSYHFEWGGRTSSGNEVIETLESITKEALRILECQALVHDGEIVVSKDEGRGYSINRKVVVEQEVEHEFGKKKIVALVQVW